MSNSVPSWDPSTHPVHRLIQLHDAAVIAFLSLKRRASQLQHPFKNGEGGEFPAFMGLVRDFREVMARIMVVAAGGTNRDAVDALKGGALAWFAGQRRPEASPVVKAAAASLAECWREPTGEELNLGPSPHHRRVSADPPARSAEDELRGFNRYHDWKPIRGALFTELAETGEDVPLDILTRLNGPSFGALLADGDPLAGLPSQEELLGLANAATVSTQVAPPPAGPAAPAAQPPAGPAADGTAERKGNAPADAAESKVPRRKPPAKEDRERLVRLAIEKRMRGAGRDKAKRIVFAAAFKLNDIAADTGLKRSTAGETVAWTSHAARYPKKGRTPAKPKAARPLTAKILAARPDPSARSPADELADGEDVEARYRSVCSPEELARFDAVTPAERREMLDLFADQLGDAS